MFWKDAPQGGKRAVVPQGGGTGEVEKSPGSRSDAEDGAAVVRSSLPTSTSGLGDVLGPTLDVGNVLADMGNTSVDLRGGMIYHATRCVANLARDTATHRWLMSCDLLGPMITILNAVPVRTLSSSLSLADALGDEQRADTVRFATLSVAALSKTAAGSVVEKRGHVPLISLLKQPADSVAQTYAAGGIRNLARHVEADLETSWLVHRNLVIDDIASALAVSLTASSNPQTQVFSTLALGDILTTRYKKSEVIAKRMKPTFEPFAALLASGNASVARACHKVVNAVLSAEADTLEMSLSSGGSQKYALLSDALAKQVGPLVRGAASKGDTAAMGAVAALCLDERTAGAIVVKGVVNILVNALAAKNEYGQQAMVAVARLSDRASYATEILLRGGLKATMNRSSAGADDGRWEAALLANMARSERNRPDIGHGGLPILMRAMNSKDERTRREGARGLYNLTIGGVSRVLSAQGGALAPLTKIVDTDDGLTREYAVGAISAISELYAFGASIVELGGIAVLLRAVEADKSLSRNVARCFAQLSNHVESHVALAKGGAVDWLVRTVSRGDTAGDTLHHAAGALCNIAYTPGSPHEALRNAKAGTALTGLANGLYTPYVCQCAKVALANLRQESDPVLQHADSFGQVDPA